MARLRSEAITRGALGYGLGVLLAGMAIKKLSGGVRAAVCYPAPIDDLIGHLRNGQGDPAERQKAVAALDRVWAKLGFEHFRNGIHVLDLNLTTLDENLAQPRKHAERYHTLRD